MPAGVGDGAQPFLPGEPEVLAERLVVVDRLAPVADAGVARAFAQPFQRDLARHAAFDEAERGIEAAREIPRREAVAD